MKKKIEKKPKKNLKHKKKFNKPKFLHFFLNKQSLKHKKNNYINLFGPMKDKFVK